MNKVLAPILETAIRESLKNYESKNDGNSLEELCLYHDHEENTFIIYDGLNQMLNKAQLPDDGYYNLTHPLRQILHQARKERLFEKAYIEKPFSVSLVDKDFIVIEELLFLDNDALKTNDSLWENIEKDLDEFIENLLQ